MIMGRFLSFFSAAITANVLFTIVSGSEDVQVLSHRKLQFVDKCPDEATALENCAVESSESTELITGCLTCVTATSLPDLSEVTSASELDCTSFQTAFCANLDTNCYEICDEGVCGQTFRDFFHCNAEAVINTFFQTIGTDQVCDIQCDGIDGLEGSPIVADDAEGEDTDGDGVPDSTGGGSDGSGFVAIGISASCQVQGGNLENCLTTNGRSLESMTACATCISETKTLSASATTCDEVQTQFCSTLTNCDTSCAKDVCAEEYTAAADCEFTVVTSALSDGCTVNSCTTSSTSGSLPVQRYGSMAVTTLGLFALTVWLIATL